ncbi:MAG TPA: FAD-binding oxidoreductase, partial [Casimicrobiaceae bacterium]
MSKFHPLSIAKVDRETRDAIAVTFDVPEALRDLFRFEAGQHLTLRADIAGEDVRRSYSICAAQGEPLRIAVKRTPGGVFSVWANDALAAGASLEVMPPMGHFNVAPEPRSARHYLGVAAGSGITPLLSMVAT